MKLNRPAKRNALNDSLFRQIITALEIARNDSAVHTVVLVGAGDGFCSGRDRDDVGGRNSPRVKLQDSSLGATVSIFRRVLSALIGLPKPTIAAVHGFALGGGQALSLACDFVVAERGTRFGNPEMLHEFPAAMNIVLLARHLGRRKALEIALTGASYAAEDYLPLGLINRMADRGELAQVTARFCEELNMRSPWAVQRTKELFQMAEDSDMNSLMHAGDQLNQLMRLNGVSMRNIRA